MPFGLGKEHETSDASQSNAPRASALVTETEEPVENIGILSGRNALAQTRILVDVGNGPVLAMRDLKLDPEHWITVGMTVPVIIDPGHPNDYEIDWSQVPSMAERAANNDAALVDPMGAKLRIWDALSAAGFQTLDMDKLAPQSLAVGKQTMKAQLEDAPKALARQLVDAAKLPAPEGFRRALVLIAATTSQLKVEQSGNIHYRQTDGIHSVVLSVNLPDRPPYAVFVPKFDHEARLYDADNPGLPAIVSLDDPSNVRVLWDEMQTQHDQEQNYKDREREYKEQQKEAARNPAPATSPAPSASPAAGPVTPPNMSPELKERMMANARNSLLTADPATRQGIIDYYKTLGMDLEATP